ncbi:MAG: hypothetical protein R3E84_05885 [Pseudomonadales bacterium]
MQLAKPAIDVGLFTNQADDMLDFWQNTAHIAFSELLPLGNGLRQHRHAISASVFKLNQAREPLPETPPSGIRHLTIATAATAVVRDLTDPDGNTLRLVPAGPGVPPLRIHLTVADLDAHRRFYAEGLGLPEIAPGSLRAVKRAS